MGLVKAFHKLLEIFQKKFPLISLQNAQKLLKTKQSKDAFYNESCSKVAQKNKTFSGVVLKYANCTTKIRFLSIFVQFWGVTSIAK